MVERITRAKLMKRAKAVYDAPDTGLATAASSAALRGFQSGADWMRMAMEQIRGETIAASPKMNFQYLGIAKYSAATAVASAWTIAMIALEWPIVTILAVPIFYAVEAQGVFLFPAAIEGDPRPFRNSRTWTIRAGGTMRVMAIVMPIAATMLAGGFLGRGFLRSWCLGCLAICIWYEELKTSHKLEPVT